MGDILKITSVQGIGQAEEQNSRYRKTMEDACVMLDKYGNNPDLGFFAVFDGHGGPECSKTASENVHKIILERVLARQLGCEGSVEGASAGASGSVRYQDAVLNFDDLQDYVEVLTDAIAAADSYMQERGHIYVGCTACICVVSKRYFTLINVGDSRAVLCAGGVAERLTHDHKALDRAEQERIKQAGGGIVMGRVNGFISVSRALGDWCIKKLVISTPDVTRRDRTKNDEFIIIACDGVWDVLNDQQAADIVLKSLKDSGSPQRAASELKNAAIRLGSQDNVSVLVVVLKEISS